MTTEQENMNIVLDPGVDVEQVVNRPMAMVVKIVRDRHGALRLHACHPSRLSYDAQGNFHRVSRVPNANAGVSK